MDYSKLTTFELRQVLLKHDQKVKEHPSSLTQDDMNEAWNAAFECLQRNQQICEMQEEELAQMREDIDDLIVTDITYRAAYKFIYEKGMDSEFREFLEDSLMDAASNVIPFPSPH